MMTEQLTLARRAALHHALAEEHRLAIVDALRLSDRTPGELALATGVASNLLAFHLDALEDVGLVQRHPSEGDGRRRYVRLRMDVLRHVEPSPPAILNGAALPTNVDHVLFVCTHNAARSQLAAALWSARTGRLGSSAGTAPAAAVNADAVAVGLRHGLDLGGASPRGYDEVADTPDLVVSVCDRARETDHPFDAPLLHWSIPDPAGGTLEQVEDAFAAIAARIDDLARAVTA